MTNPLHEFRPESLCLLKESQEDYWRYARKGPTDFSVYTEKSSIYKIPTKEKFKEAAVVLVRWTDGLFYIANIIKVEEEEHRCAVRFEDGSQFYALYKDIYKSTYINGEIVCIVCDSGLSNPPDEIVICDHCSMGYHQLCHIPPIDKSILKPDITWRCRKCIFALTTKKGGALKKGPHAQTMMAMKQFLPYDPKTLIWDNSHRSNIQQTYCYCGGPGEWCKNMLQCTRCRQWFHEACLQCLEEPILYGDRFYIFVCSVCNKGNEFLRRLPLRWPEIAHLVLYNLSVVHNKKYFDFDTIIMNFLKDNWTQFQVKGGILSRMSMEEKKQNMSKALQNGKSRFTSGKGKDVKSIVWGLRSRVPPPSPIFTLPESGAITNDVLDSLLSSAKKSLHVKSNSTSHSIKRSYKSTFLDSDNSSSKSFHKNEKSLQSNITDMKNNIHRPKRRGRKKKNSFSNHQHFQQSTRTNGARKFTYSSLNGEISDDDTSSSQDTLNTIIPHPLNFEGQNNPFLSTYMLNTSQTNSLFTVTRTNVNNLLQSGTNTRFKLRSRRKFDTSSPRSLVNRLLNETENDSTALRNNNISSTSLSSEEMNNSVTSYFGAENRIANGEKFNILAKRVAPDGKVQYLIEWEGIPS